MMQDDIQRFSAAYRAMDYAYAAEALAMNRRSCGLSWRATRAEIINAMKRKRVTGLDR
jgi:hypothetical protein